MKRKSLMAVSAAEVSRRGLVKTTAIGGLAMASSALTLPFSRIAHAVDSAIDKIRRKGYLERLYS